ncbi:6-hydroxynicotinate 3-monooxygenase-like protein, partial [Trifolium pratense]
MFSKVKYLLQIFRLLCLERGTHSVLYELLNKKLNWLWYVNQPEPEVKGTSVTTKVTGDMIQKMHQEAEKIWIPELAK